MTNPRERILFVDDEEAIRKLLYQKLSSEGYLCQEAGTADEALHKMRSNPPALVILDIKMPGKSGTELLPELKASYPDTVVIMVTAKGHELDQEYAKDMGADGYITKPFTSQKLLDIVNRFLTNTK